MIIAVFIDRKNKDNTFTIHDSNGSSFTLPKKGEKLALEFSKKEGVNIYWVVDVLHEYSKESYSDSIGHSHPTVIVEWFCEYDKFMEMMV